MVIVLAMHGSPPNDFPEDEKVEYFKLHATPSAMRNRSLTGRLDLLEAKIRHWPRTEQNDFFHASSHKLAASIQGKSGCTTLVGFNEFCNPTVAEALDQAVRRAEGAVAVVTPMMTPGGKHAEREIPLLIQEAKQRHPGTDIVYVWPFDVSDVASFLTEQIQRRFPRNK